MVGWYTLLFIRFLFFRVLIFVSALKTRLGFVDILHNDPASELVQGICRIIGAPLVVNRGFGTVMDWEDVAALVADGVAEAVGVGRPALANPDLVERWRTGAPENTPIQETIYGGGAKGYTDYPALQG